MTNPNSLIDYISQSLQNSNSPSEVARKKGYLWARVSTNTQMERKLSIHQQKQEIREFAEKHEIEIIYDNCAYGDYKFLYISVAKGVHLL